MIVALAGLKGGCGRTTLSLHLAGEVLARGKTALLLDADLQRSALTFLDVAKETGKPAPDIVAVSEDKREEIPLLAAPYAFTFVDCAPRSDLLTRAALAYADVALVPCGPSPTEVWTTEGTATLIKEMQTLRDLKAAFVLVRINPRTAIAKGLPEGLAKLGLPILSTFLSYRVAFAESLASGQTVATYEPKGPAAQEVRSLLDEILTFGGASDHGKQDGNASS